MGRPKHQKDLSADERREIALFLAEGSVNGRPAHGRIKKAAEKFGHSRKTIAKIWRVRGRASDARRGRPPDDGTSARVADRVERVRLVPRARKKTLRALSAAAGIPLTTFHRYLRRGWVKRVVTRVKPTLTQAHKYKRLTYTLDHVQRPIGMICVL